MGTDTQADGVIYIAPELTGLIPERASGSRTNGRFLCAPNQFCLQNIFHRHHKTPALTSRRRSRSVRPGAAGDSTRERLSCAASTFARHQRRWPSIDPAVCVTEAFN